MNKLWYLSGCIAAVLISAVIIVMISHVGKNYSHDGSLAQNRAESEYITSDIASTPSAVTDNTNSKSTETPSKSSTESASSTAATDTPAEKVPSAPAKAEHTHSWSSKTIAATCTEGGYTLKTCTCGNTEKTAVTAALGHSFGDWVTVTEATQTAAGLKRRACLRCGVAEEQTVEKLPQSTLDWHSEVLRLVNIERTNAGLQALEYYHAGQTAADTRASEIKTNFSHTRPNGQSCFTALSELGISYRTAGENIAWGYQSPEQVVSGWMNSEGHRANILSPNFTHLIVGNNATHWVQLFLGL